LPVLAQDRATREIVGCFVGNRDDEGATGLWQNLPDCSLEAETHVDLWRAYNAIFYAKTLHHVGKDSGHTNHIERFNNTSRQRTGPEGAALSKTALFSASRKNAFLLEKA